MNRKAGSSSRLGSSDEPENGRSANLPPRESAQKWFKCPCDGENSQCVHCGGTGTTSHEVALRSSHTFSVEKASSEPFRSKREKLFDLQVSRELQFLRDKFLNESGGSPAIFVDYLVRLIEKTSPSFLHFCSKLRAGDLKGFASAWNRDSHLPESFRIILKATDDALAVYERALAVKRSQRGKKSGHGELFYRPFKMKGGAPNVMSTPMEACPECGKLVGSLELHVQLHHPGIYPKHKRIRTQNTTAAEPQQAPSQLPPQTSVTAQPTGKVEAVVVRPVHKMLICPQCEAKVKSNRLHSHIQRNHQPPIVEVDAADSGLAQVTASKRSSKQRIGSPEKAIAKKNAKPRTQSQMKKALPKGAAPRVMKSVSGLHANLSRDSVDTERVERKMDARRTWGGSFRDTNGTFGSYPLHDSMDDESGAG